MGLDGSFVPPLNTVQNRVPMGSISNIHVIPSTDWLCVTKTDVTHAILSRN